MLKIIKNGTVLTPENIGVKQILIGGNNILAIEDEIIIDNVEVEIIDATGCYVTPGLIDPHVHICGGGGEGGFSTRTPEVKLADITSAGITTVVGVLGTDGITRTMTNLIAKAHALEEEGISTFIYTGSYQTPIRTATGNITEDMILVEKIIGVGEVAISDHRSSCPTTSELSKIASDTRLGGMLSGKAGIVHLHMGDDKNPLAPIYDVLENTMIPITQFLPTHMNRNPVIYQDGIQYALKGGYVDFTTSTTPEFIEDGEVEASDAVIRMLEAGVKIENMTLSSDGQGSLPVFDSDGNLSGLKIGTCSSILEVIRKLHFEKNLDIDRAFKIATSNPADILKLKNKGRISVGFDNDIAILKKENLEIQHLICKGKLMIENQKIIVTGKFD